MAPRTGRPKSENPRSKRISVSLTESDYQLAEEQREKDKKPEQSLAAWVARKVSELLRKSAKK